jgi:hypothetical protein
MTVAVTSDRPLPMAATAVRFDDDGGAITAPAVEVAETPRLRKVAGVLEDIGFLVLVVLVFPLAILVIGTPIALGIRLLVAIAHRL